MCYGNLHAGYFYLCVYDYMLNKYRKVQYVLFTNGHRVTYKSIELDTYTTTIESHYVSSYLRVRIPVPKLILRYGTPEILSFIKECTGKIKA
jgi:hypothetical protein